MEYERIAIMDMTPEELEAHFMEQIWARVVLQDLERGRVTHEPTEGDMEVIYDAAQRLARLIRPDYEARA